MDPMNGTNLDSRIDNTLSFMDELDKHEGLKKEIDNVRNTPEVKRRIIEQQKDCGKDSCLKYVIGKVYGDSIPNTDYTPADDLDKVVSDFAKRRLAAAGVDCDSNECLYYVKEALKNNPKSAFKNIYEAVESIVNRLYFEKEININDVKPDDLGFNFDDTVKSSLDDVIRDNNLDALSDVIKTNVKDSVAAEIDAAKREKEERMDLEDSLASNPSVTSETDVQTAVESVNIFNTNSFYQPSLFEGIMINKFNALESVPLKPFEESDVYTEGVFSAIKDYFKTKAAADAKATIVTNSKGFTAWLDRIYRNAYGSFRSNILSINLNQLTKSFDEALKQEEVINPNQAIKVINVDKTKEFYDDVTKKNMDALDNPKIRPITFPDSYFVFTISIDKFSAEVKKAEKYIHTVFDKPKLKEFIDKYDKLAVEHAKKAGTAKEVNLVYDKVSNMALCEINTYYIHLQQILSFTNYAKQVIRYVTRTTMKESAYEEAVKEYTMYNVAKALYLENFYPDEVKNIAIMYANGKM